MPLPSRGPLNGPPCLLPIPPTVLGRGEGVDQRHLLHEVAANAAHLGGTGGGRSYWNGGLLIFGKAGWRKIRTESCWRRGACLYAPFCQGRFRVARRLRPCTLTLCTSTHQAQRFLLNKSMRPPPTPQQAHTSSQRLFSENSGLVQNAMSCVGRVGSGGGGHVL